MPFCIFQVVFPCLILYFQLSALTRQDACISRSTSHFIARLFEDKKWNLLYMCDLNAYECLFVGRKVPAFMTSTLSSRGIASWLRSSIFFVYSYISTQQWSFWYPWLFLFYLYIRNLHQLASNDMTGLWSHAMCYVQSKNTVGHLRAKWDKKYHVFDAGHKWDIFLEEL